MTYPKQRYLGLIFIFYVCVFVHMCICVSVCLCHVWMGAHKGQINSLDVLGL